MKKVFLTAFVGLLCLSQVYAQTEKGNILLGTSVGGSNASIGYSGGTSRTINLGIAPTMGIFVSDDFLIGGTLGFGYIRSKDDFDNKSSSTNINIGPLLRYYFSGGKVKPFLTINPAYGFRRTKIGFFTNDEIISKNNAFILAGGFGLAIFIHDKLSVDVQLGVINQTIQDSSDNNNFTSFGVTAGFSFFK